MKREQESKKPSSLVREKTNGEHDDLWILIQQISFQQHAKLLPVPVAFRPSPQFSFPCWQVVNLVEQMGQRNKTCPPRLLKYHLPDAQPSRLPSCSPDHHQLENLPKEIVSLSTIDAVSFGVEEFVIANVEPLHHLLQHMERTTEPSPLRISQEEEDEDEQQYVNMRDNDIGWTLFVFVVYSQRQSKVEFIWEGIIGGISSPVWVVLLQEEMKSSGSRSISLRRQKTNIDKELSRSRVVEFQAYPNKLPKTRDEIEHSDEECKSKVELEEDEWDIQEEM